MKYHCRLDLSTNTIHLVILDRQNSSACTKLEFSKFEEGSYLDSCISLVRSEAQELMDELWTCGVRPTEASGAAGILEATERHLEDMKKIAFQLLEKQLG